NAADVGAMATYLLGDKPPAPQALKPANADAGAMATGRQHYLAVC
ncbi:MAG TPA: cytochrome C oxidase Cbb3, partial [Cupriavidus sp.]|nr:cytochrome C oxidase Cbb3 [Cupriavidus sp.]